MLYKQVKSGIDDTPSVIDEALTFKLDTFSFNQNTFILSLHAFSVIVVGAIYNDDTKSVKRKARNVI